MNVIDLPISEIIPYENNPRNNDGAVDAVAASIREFGFKVPVIIDKNNILVAGHTRLKAAKKLGLAKVPAIRADDLTEEQIKAFRIADNKTSELAEWDFRRLEAELDKIQKIDMSAFGFSKEDHEWFDRNEKDGEQREEGNEEYNEFLDKFEPKKTTDDCYTPENIYKAVTDWVVKEYNVNAADFVRPFYPGGDYKARAYRKTNIVVDNPPFSILAEIIDFYIENGVRFFLFAPALTSFNYLNRELTVVCIGSQVVYENGANVNTSFLTNLEPGIAARTAPDLREAIDEQNDENSKGKQMPKYTFPVHVLTGAKLNYLSRYGQLYKVRRSDCYPVDRLDSMKEYGKEIYGKGVLLSERAAAERAAAERAAAERAAEQQYTWELSERELEIIKNLGDVS